MTTRYASGGFTLPLPTLDRTIDEMIPHMPVDAIPLAARNRLQDLARWIPAGMTNLVYFESRLGQPDAPVDMILCVEEPGLDLLGRHSWRAEADVSSVMEPWARLERWAARWRDSEQRPSSAGVRPTLWVEFDVNTDDAVYTATELPTPSVFVGFAPNAVRRGTNTTALANAIDGCAPIIDDVTRTRLCRMLPEVLDALPDCAHVEYLGMMMSRAGSPARICFSQFTWEAVWQFADALGFPDDPALRAAVRCANTAGPGVVHIDLGESVGPSLGLECILDRRSQVFGTLPNREFFASLMADGVIPPTAWDDLKCWPGCSRALFAHQLWPSVLSRRVNHIKLVGQPSGLPLAKAYMCGGHRYFAPLTHAPASPS